MNEYLVYIQCRSAVAGLVAAILEGSKAFLAVADDRCVCVCVCVCVCLRERERERETGTCLMLPRQW